MGYSESTLAQTSVLNVTPNGNEGSIWMAGAGLAATNLNASGFPHRRRLRQRFHEALDFRQPTLRGRLL